MARGHRIESVPEVPLVISNSHVTAVDKTSKAVKLLKELAAYEDIERVKNSRHIRPGKGKMRNRRYKQGRGPLVVYSKKGSLSRSLRNIPGVETCNVSKLNLLQLAPGGHLGRFIIWTQDAFERLDKEFGTYSEKSARKKGYSLPRPQLVNTDIARIINSEEIQKILRPKISNKRRFVRKKNPLKNLGAMIKLNPYAKSAKRHAILAQQANEAKKLAYLERKKAGKLTKEDKEQKKQKKELKNKIRAQRKPFYKFLLDDGLPVGKSTKKTEEEPQEDEN
jgi:large subunit ribosomal protein L4e